MRLPRTPSFRLDGKRALVTGASRGLGLGSAVALAELGAHVVMVARSFSALETAAAMVKAEGMSAQAQVLDVTDLDAMAAFFTAEPAFDVLVNSAGLARHSTALETRPEDFDAVMNLNVRGAYFLAQYAARGMKQQGQGGSIIQISSQMGHVGGLERAVYCGSKHAIEGINKAMAIEFGAHGIRVNSICPTFIRTPLSEPSFSDPEKLAWIKSKIKVDKLGEIEDIMGAVQYLASEASALVTGTALLIDGGWTAD